MQQRRRLIAMVDIYNFLYPQCCWPGFGNLINSEPDQQRQAVIDNPAIADWFFTTTLKGFFYYFT